MYGLYDECLCMHSQGRGKVLANISTVSPPIHTSLEGHGLPFPFDPDLTLAYVSSQGHECHVRSQLKSLRFWS